MDYCSTLSLSFLWNVLTLTWRWKLGACPKKQYCWDRCIKSGLGGVELTAGSHQTQTLINCKCSDRNQFGCVTGLPNFGNVRMWPMLREKLSWWCSVPEGFETNKLKDTCTHPHWRLTAYPEFWSRQSTMVSASSWSKAEWRIMWSSDLKLSTYSLSSTAPGLWMRAY